MIPSRVLTDGDAKIVLALLARGVTQHDIAALFSCSPGRIAEIAAHRRPRVAEPADLSDPNVRLRLEQLRIEANARPRLVLTRALNPEGKPAR